MATIDAIEAWLIARVAEKTGFDRSEVDVHQALESFGLTSKEAVILAADLEDLVGRRLPPRLVYDYPNIAALAEHLAEPHKIANPGPTRATPAQAEPVAIVGIGCRFPGGADNPQLFWQLLCEGFDAITEIPLERWDWHALRETESMEPGKMNARWGGLLQHIDLFDRHAFGFSPREAERLDPQQRLLLEVTWQGLEDAGLDLQQLGGSSTGVFIGCCSNDYAFLQTCQPFQIDTFVATGNARNMVSSRLSYWFDFRGPSLTIDTGCSSSLTAVHLACESLARGESSLAVAGGVNVMLLPEAHIASSRVGLLAPDGRCKVFDASADGYVRSEGAGVVVLKRLADAVADKDPIYAVIRGTAVNQDGRSEGTTSPNLHAQMSVLDQAYRNAGVLPSDVQYVEAHGTGTLVGDAIEAKALGAVLASGRKPWEKCLIGSVKSNVGHMEGAAGIASLIKVALSLRHGAIPPTLHFKEPSPHIPFEKLPLRVVRELEPWPATDNPARAGVTTFSVGGSNAHAVLEEAPPSGATDSGRQLQLLLLSAMTEPALDQATKNLAEHIKSHPDVSLADVAYTLHTGRKVFSQRRAVLCRDHQNATRSLETLDPEYVIKGPGEMDKHSLTFMFPGEGEQYGGMTRGLYECEQDFREQIDLCARLLEPHLGLDLRPIIFQRTGSGEPGHAMAPANAAAGRFASVRDSRPSVPLHLGQLVVFVVEYSFARMLMGWGFKPQTMVGHGVGEYVAACLAEVLSLEDTLSLLVYRARLIQELPTGAALAVSLSPTAILEKLNGDFFIAAVNAPNLCSVVGPLEATLELAERLQLEGITCRPLHSSLAFQSDTLRTVAAPFRRLVETLPLGAPKVPYLSNVTGEWITPQDGTDPEYWVRHLLQTVRFSDGIERLLQGEGSQVLLEVGPGFGLNSLVKLHSTASAKQNLVVLPTLRPAHHEEDDLAFLLRTVGKLWTIGVAADRRGFYGHQRRQRLRLPSYPFQKKRYWADSRPVSQNTGPISTRNSETPVEEGSRRAPIDTPVTEARGPYNRRPVLTAPYVPPAHAMEKTIVSMWQDLLGVEPIGIRDDFFELGGKSLLAIDLAARLREVVKVDLPLREILQHRTVAALAQVIGAKESEGAAVEPKEELRQIVPQAGERYAAFPLTDVQHAYWMGRRSDFELGGVATHSYLEIDTVDLDLPRFTKAWRRLIQRHDMLRAIIRGDGYQQVLESVPEYEIEVLDLRGQAEGAVDEELGKVRERMSHQVLAVERWPLFELRATRQDEHRLRLHLSYDLLIGDAWSGMVLSGELWRLYQEPEAQLEELTVTFRDYVLAEAELESSARYQESLEYWRERAPGLPGAAELPLANNPASIERPRFTRRASSLTAEQWRQFKLAAAQAGVTPSVGLAAAYAEVLTGWSKNPRFTLNLTLFNRQPLHRQVGSLIGDFTSLTMLAVDNTEGGSFQERAQRVQGQLWKDLDHRQVSGVRVLREVAKLQGVAQAVMPIVFTSTLGQGQGEQDSSPLTTLANFGKVVFSISQTPQVWLDHQVSEQKGRLLTTWDSVDELFPAGLVEEMFEAYCSLLQRLSRSSEEWTRAELCVFPPAQAVVRERVNATQGPITGELLHGLFEAQAQRSREQIAVVSGDVRLSYGELRDRALQVAARLSRLEPKRNSLVAVATEKGWQQIVGVLAVLYSGAAYLPIDPALPKERIEFLLQDGCVSHILTTEEILGRFDWMVKFNSIAIDAPFQGEVASLSLVQRQEDLAYVIYTSGSTGNPKGVMIDHRGAVNTVLDVNERFGITSEDRVLAISSLSFDLSVYDIFGTLAVGGIIVVPNAQYQKSPKHWLELIIRERISVWNSVPALMQVLVEECQERGFKSSDTLRVVMLSGDWIPLALPGRIQEVFPCAQMIAMGGATEASIWSIYHRIIGIEPGWNSIPYGWPMRNQTFYVLDSRLRPSPDWVEGDLFIGGIGVALGYWRNQEKTEASFLQHPATGERLFRTGDRGRYLPSGEIEFLGRKDTQVKIHGHRIELGEIETALTRHPSVRQAVATVQGDNALQRRLVAYVVPDGEQATAGNGHLPSESIDFHDQDGVIQDEMQRLDFRLQQPGLREFPPEARKVDLFKPEWDAARLGAHMGRQTYRDFRVEVIPFEDFSEMLSSLRQLQSEDNMLPKYRYPSAGSLYPVQAYVHVRQSCVSGLDRGVYYYNPREHSLVQINSVATLRVNQFPGNETQYWRSAFTIFLVGNMSAIEPMYGTLARDFCLLEAGCMGQLLMTVSPDSLIGLCPIGNLDQQSARALLELESHQEMLHCMLGGRITNEQIHRREPFLQNLNQSGFPKELETYLAKVLPAHMVPVAFAMLERLPLSYNGKVDVKRLPEMELPDGERAYEAPRNETEQTLAEIWRQVLAVSNVGINDEFFALGGNSLSLIRTAARIKQRFGIDISIRDMFERRTIKHLAELLMDARSKGLNVTEHVESILKELHFLSEDEAERLLASYPVASRTEQQLK